MADIVNNINCLANNTYSINMVFTRDPLSGVGVSFITLVFRLRTSSELYAKIHRPAQTCKAVL